VPWGNSGGRDIFGWRLVAGHYSVVEYSKHGLPKKRSDMLQKTLGGDAVMANLCRRALVLKAR
jgi:hypothetical protein